MNGEVRFASMHASRLLAAIVASSDDAIISKSMDGLITSWNAGAENIFGYAGEEVIGKPIALLAMPGREDEMKAIMKRLLGGERIDHFETVRRHKNGSGVLVSLTVSPVYDESGGMIGASKVARDITEARRAAEALQAAQEKLREQHRELLHAARLGELGQMAAILAHEVTQPLSAIANYVQAGQRLFSRDEPGDCAKLGEALEKAKEQALRAGAMVRRMRSFARQSDGALQREPIGPMIKEALALATIDAGQRGVRVEFRPESEEREVLADRIQVQQVLLNLIRNSMEAMEGQPQRALCVSTSVVGDWLEVAVADTGPGLAPEVSEKLFQPFVTTKDAGMGIGLSICLGIIDVHGGRS